MLAVMLLWPARASAEPPVRCRHLSFAVTLTPDSSTTYDMAAWLCARGTIHHKTIQVLVHGASFDHNYWNFPVQPEKHSYVRHITRAGYAVLNLDRIGFGLSDHPQDGLDLSLHKGAFTIHQVVQALRGGDMVVPGFGRIRAERVQLVGSSMGSFISIIEASTYKDVDGVVLTSYSHRVGPGGIASFTASFPAHQDPKFSFFPLLGRTNYLSTDNETRAFLLYHLPNMDPIVRWIDTALRQPLPAGDLNDIIPSLMEPVAIEVPTLIVNGDFDTIACQVPCTANNWLENELSFYPPETCAELEIIPNAGHALTLHKNAPAFFEVVEEWSDRRVGASTKSAPPEPCP